MCAQLVQGHGLPGLCVEVRVGLSKLLGEDLLDVWVELQEIIPAFNFLFAFQAPAGPDKSNVQVSFVLQFARDCHCPGFLVILMGGALPKPPCQLRAWLKTLPIGFAQMFLQRGSSTRLCVQSRVCGIPRVPWARLQGRAAGS